MIGATNRPDMIDKAMLRPKRLGLPLYVPIPNQPSRYQILMTLTRHLRAKNKMEGVDLTSLSFSTEGYSGADLSALVQEASTLTLTESFKTAVPKPAVITAAHFQRALQKIRRSVSPEVCICLQFVCVLINLISILNFLNVIENCFLFFQ